MFYNSLSDSNSVHFFRGPCATDCLGLIIVAGISLFVQATMPLAGTNGAGDGKKTAQNAPRRSGVDSTNASPLRNSKPNRSHILPSQAIANPQQGRGRSNPDQGPAELSSSVMQNGVGIDKKTNTHSIGLINGREAVPAPTPSHVDMSLLGKSISHGRVGVLPFTDDALQVGDDGRAIVWFDIDNTLYRKSTRIAELMTHRIRKYMSGLGLSDEEVERLHSRYYKEYGLAIRGLVMHHKIDALDYDAKCDAALPLEDILQPDPGVKSVLRDLDRSKCRVWALTNAYKTHAMRVLKLLELDTFMEGVVFCDYTMENFACKPEEDYYNSAMEAIGMRDVSRCYFVDDSPLNIHAARKLGWGQCVLFQEQEEVRPENESINVHQNDSHFDTVLARIKASGSSGLDEEAIIAAVQSLSGPLRTRLLHIVLEACTSGNITAMKQILDRQISRSHDHFSNQGQEIQLKILQRLPIRDLLAIRGVSQKWQRLSQHPSLWRSHALALTEGDSAALVPPSSTEKWESVVKGLFFRERNWARGACQSITMMSGHTGFVTAMKLKGQGTLVTGSYDETIRVWDLPSGVCKKVLRAKAISSLDFLSTQGVLAAGLYDTGRVLLWDMRTWTLLQTLNGHNRGIRHVAISEDYLVSVGQDKAIVVWDWRSGTKIVRFGQQSNVSLGVSIVDQDKLVAVTVDGIVRTFDLGSTKKEMLGQFDIAKLSPELSSRLSGLRDGSTMMQWFAAHGDTITLGSQNTVVHLQWQEVVSLVRSVDAESDHTSSPTQSRARKESISSVASAKSGSSNAARGISVHASPETPRKTDASASVSRTPSIGEPSVPRKYSDMSYRTPSRSSKVPSHQSQTALSSSRRSSAVFTPSRSTSASSPARQKISMQSRNSVGLQSSVDSQEGIACLSETADEHCEADKRFSSTEKESFSSTSTRIAPNLAAAPRVISVTSTAESAVGCVDAVKKRIVCASRFSSRAGADRKLYTTTFGAQEPQTTGVVPIGGAWQAQAKELATPARNPMSLVLGPDHCVVGTNSGLIYSMKFTGSEYTQGWHELQQRSPSKSNRDTQDVITDIPLLRKLWSSLFINS